MAGNDIANTTAENIDIKEGTTGGKIIGNQFNGTGMVESAATGWINVKGNDWTVQGNTGTDSVKNGYQVHQVYPGWGTGNVFIGNRAQVNGPGSASTCRTSDWKPWWPATTSWSRPDAASPPSRARRADRHPAPSARPAPADGRTTSAGREAGTAA